MRALSAIVPCLLALAGPVRPGGAFRGVPGTPGGEPLGRARAVARARNDPCEESGAVRSTHPRYEVRFDADGTRVRPHHGPEWTWSLVRLATEDGTWVHDAGVAGTPYVAGTDLVACDRGPVAEQYVLGADSLEQRFVIHRPLGSGSSDLVIEGAVRCGGAFGATETGWRWADGLGLVTLGGVRVHDALGRPLAADMQVRADRTLIRVDGAALAGATYPVTVDPEIGADDFRISHMGPDGDPDYDATDVAVAYAGRHDEYLVVWAASDDEGGLAIREFEIYGQRIRASDGAEVGEDDFRISAMGPDGDPRYNAYDPAVVYNPTRDEYLVVWAGTDDTSPLVAGETEIYVQRLDGATGAAVGTDDQRISAMGPDGDPSYDAFRAAVAYDAVRDEYLVVWSGDDDRPPLVEGEFEIFGQRLDGATGAEIGSDDFRISDMGPDGGTFREAQSPAVAWRSAGDEYLVVWEGDDDAVGCVNDEFEIFGQRLDGTGAEIGANDFRISDMGPDGKARWDAVAPAVAYDPVHDEYLVVWEGDDDANGGLDGDLEIRAQRLAAATGAEVGTNDFPVSEMGPVTSPLYLGRSPGVVHDPSAGEYVVVWAGTDDAGALLTDEYEIYAQRLDAASGDPVGADDPRLSEMGPDGNRTFDAFEPAISHGREGYLVVWEGDDSDVGAQLGSEFEVYGQRLAFWPASTVFRNAGANPASYVAGPAVLGATLVASVDNSLAGQGTSLLFAFDTPVSVPLPGGQVLLCLDHGGLGELFTGAGLLPGSSAAGVDGYSLPIPIAVELLGAELCSQALQFGVPPFVLSNAQDLTIGG